MRYVAAYMLAVLGGNEQPSADDVRTIIESVGVEVDESSLKILMDKLEGKNIHDIQEEGEITLKVLIAFIYLFIAFFFFLRNET